MELPPAPPPASPAGLGGGAYRQQDPPLTRSTFCAAFLAARDLRKAPMPVLDLFPKTGRREIILVGKQNKNRKTQQRETQRNHSRDLLVLDLLPALCRLPGSRSRLALAPRGGRQSWACPHAAPGTLNQPPDLSEPQFPQPSRVRIILYTRVWEVSE